MTQAMIAACLLVFGTFGAALSATPVERQANGKLQQAFEHLSRGQYQSAILAASEANQMVRSFDARYVIGTSQCRLPGQIDNGRKTLSDLKRDTVNGLYRPPPVPGDVLKLAAEIETCRPFPEPAGTGPVEVATGGRRPGVRGMVVPTERLAILISLKDEELNNLDAVSDVQVSISQRDQLSYSIGGIGAVAVDKASAAKADAKVLAPATQIQR
ncbi:MAG: hypothetical protein KF842_13170 [Caulobacter sp.]|nr:hypothetical protein [Caulobacter sp.]